MQIIVTVTSSRNTDLSVERKIIKFQVLQEASLDPPPLVNCGFTFQPVTDSLPDGLLRFPQIIFNVQLGVPVLVPFYVLQTLSTEELMTI